MPNPLQLLNLTRNIPGVSQVVRFAGQQPVVRQILQNIKKTPVRKAAHGAVAVGPDVAIGLPMEYAFSKVPEPHKTPLAVANVAAEIGTSLLLGGGEIPAQLVDMFTANSADTPGPMGDVHAMAAVLNPSNYTQTYITEPLVLGKVDPEKEAYLARQRKRTESIRPQSGVLPTLIMPR